MSAVSQQSVLVTAEEYLAGEETSSAKHEYLSGRVYAMAGGTVRHAAIALNLGASLKGKLRGKPCQPFNSDVLVHLRAGADERFYYPDLSVVCHPVMPQARMIEDPTVIFEVLSDSTERHDRGEKKDAYLRCSTLQAYVLVESERVAVTMYSRRGEGWEALVYNELTDLLPLPALGCELSLAEIYE